MIGREAGAWAFFFCDFCWLAFCLPLALSPSLLLPSSPLVALDERSHRAHPHNNNDNNNNNSPAQITPTRSSIRAGRHTQGATRAQRKRGRNNPRRKMSYAAAHRARVMLLYRRALKTALDWSGDRRQWYGRARAVRGEFEANRVTVSRLWFPARAAPARRRAGRPQHGPHERGRGTQPSPLRRRRPYAPNQPKTKTDKPKTIHINKTGDARRGRPPARPRRGAAQGVAAPGPPGAALLGGRHGLLAQPAHERGREDQPGLWAGGRALGKGV